MRHAQTTAILMLTAATANAQTWSNPAGGDWMTPSNWDGLLAPNDPAAAAVIAIAGDYTVTLSAPGAIIASLTITNPNGIVHVGPGAQLALRETLSHPPSLHHLTIDADAGSLHAANDATIDAGRIVLGGGTAAMTADPGARFTIGSRAQITGGGTINADIDLAGQLRAENPAAPLVLTGSPKAFSGFGFVDPECTLSLVDVDLDFTGGNLISYEGEFDISGAHITGGFFDIVFIASLHVRGDSTMAGTNLGGRCDIDHGATLEVQGSLSNTGALHVNADQHATPASILIPEPGTELLGFGGIVLHPGGSIRGEPFATQQLIMGEGRIDAPATIAGRFEPGMDRDQIGTLHASAPVQFEHTAISRFDLAPDGSSDAIESTSTFHADGALIVNLPEGLTVDDDWSATIVRADAGVTGEFSSVFQPAPVDQGRMIRATYLPDRIVVASSCTADYDGSGTADFFDIAEFVAQYSRQSSNADLAPPYHVLNFFDVAAFIDAFTLGCP